MYDIMNCIIRNVTYNFYYGKLYVSYVAYVYNGKLVSLIGNQRAGIFQPKSKILFYLSLALIWCQNFQDWAIPVGGVTWPSLKIRNLFPTWEISELDPPKSKILFSLRISFIWYRKIQDWPFPLGGVRWPKYAECWPVRRKEEEEERERHVRRELAHADSLKQNYGNNERRWTVSCATIVGQ